MICEICKTKDVKLDTHHIISKSKGGKNNKSNLCNLCPNCHRQIHTGEIILEGKFDSTDGKILIWRLKSEQSITKNIDPKVYIIKGKN